MKKVFNVLIILVIVISFLFLTGNYIINKNNIYPSKEGYKNLSEKIIEKIVEIY